MEPMLTGPNKYIPNENVGVYVALNQALKETKSRYVLIASSDAFCAPGWYAPTIRILQDRKWGWAGPMEHNEEEYNIDFFWQTLVMPFPTSLIHGRAPSCFGIMDWHMMRDKVGLFDEQFFLTFGDTDYVERMRDAHIDYGTIMPHRVLHLVRKQIKVLDEGLTNWLTTWDEQLFRHKWKNRPEVLERHPLMCYEI